MQIINAFLLALQIASAATYWDFILFFDLPTFILVWDKKLFFCQCIIAQRLSLEHTVVWMCVLLHVLGKKNSLLCLIRIAFISHGLH